MVSRSSQYQCLLWAPNVHCFEWCAKDAVLPTGDFYRQIWSKLAKLDPLW